MSSPAENDWPEHLICARCNKPLPEDYKENSLGLRFCPECFDTTITEKRQEREAEIFLRKRCSNCGGSLINGYRLSKLGVIYCISCYRNLPEARNKTEPA